MLKFIPFIFSLALLTSCTSRKDVSHISENTTTGLRDTMEGQREINLLMQNDSLPAMPLTGKAQNQKGGAVVITKTETFWIDGLHSWDDTFVNHPVRVWGEIIMRSDNPVFLDTGEVVSQGIPVESEEELKAQQNRYWIVNARYELVRP